VEPAVHRNTKAIHPLAAEEDLIYQKGSRLLRSMIAGANFPAK
jgi:hypothetical protein